MTEGFELDSAQDFAAIEDRATYSYGQVWDSDIQYARALLARVEDK